MQVSLLRSGQRQRLQALIQAPIRLWHSACRPHQLGAHGPHLVPRTQHVAGPQLAQLRGAARRTFSSGSQSSPPARGPGSTLVNAGSTKTAMGTIQQSVKGAGAAAYKLLPGSVSRACPFKQHITWHQNHASASWWLLPECMLLMALLEGEHRIACIAGC